MKLRILTFALLVIVFGCTKNSGKADMGPANSGDVGKGGSLAKFTIAGSFLYVVDGFDLKVYDISKPTAAQSKNIVSVGFPVETIFPFKDKLFIGSRDGMFIYSLDDPAMPSKLGEARHVRSCDPVVANDSVSYITLRGGSPCGPAEDGLYIYDIKNIESPVQKGFLSITSPLGLGLQDTVVFVCREELGLTVVNVKNTGDPKVMYTLNDASYKDVIPYDDLLICYTSAGLLLYDMTDLNKLVKVGGVKY